MTVLILGVLLWTGAHLFKRALPRQRAALGRAGRVVVAAAIAASIALMIIGYRAAEIVPLYALPIWAWYLNNLLMLAAIFMMGVGGTNGVVRTKVRHPMLLGVVIWSAAHLLVSGDLASLVLFGGLGAWALVQMAVISRAEGDWQPPAMGAILGDGKVALIAVALYALIAAIHDWLGVPVIDGPLAPVARQCRWQGGQERHDVVAGLGRVDDLVG
jgi:hypothetical protein